MKPSIYIIEISKERKIAVRLDVIKSIDHFNTNIVILVDKNAEGIDIDFTSLKAARTTFDQLLAAWMLFLKGVQADDLNKASNISTL
jgi:hypothetical protein